jgi:hypothetical protein
VATHTVTTADNYWNITTPWKGSPVNAGDTINIVAGVYNANFIGFDGLDGANGNPITITNTGGQVRGTFGAAGSSSMKMTDCSYLDFLGNGSVGITYGFYWGERFRILNDVHHVTVAWHERTGGTSRVGIQAKQNPATKADTLHHLTFHHCYVHDIFGEAFYLGDADYIYGGTDYRTWDIIVRNCIANNTGEGIQCRAMLETGTNLVYDNLIINQTSPYNPPGFKAYPAAINIDYGAHVKVYNNIIRDCAAHSIVQMNFNRNDAFPNEYYNNLIVRTGESHTEDDFRHAIRIRDTHPAYIYNNTIVTTGFGGLGKGINLRNTNTTSQIYNNIILNTSANDAIQAQGLPGANIHDNLTDTVADSEDNTAYSIADMDFVASGSDNYHLQNTSPAVDAGTAVGAPADDLDNQTRDASPDVGCYEYLTFAPVATVTSTVAVPVTVTVSA